MNDFLLQTILAQRNDDVERLMNILFIVVLAAFWLIGGIIKAKANKSGAQKKQPPRKPARKPSVHSTEAREQMLRKLKKPAESAQSKPRQPRPATQKPRMKFSDLQAAVRKFAAEAEQAFQMDTEKPAPKPNKPVSPKPQIQYDTVELPQTKSTIIEKPQKKQALEPTQTAESEDFSELLSDYSDPDQLKRAILHYEILGRPLSLRDHSGGGIL